MISEYSHVLFDMDGVLWDSNSAHEKAYQEALGSMGLMLSSYRLVAGRRTDEVIEEIILEAGREASAGLISKLTATKRAAASRYLETSPEIMPECEYVLRRLSANKKLALVSSSSRRNVDIFLKESRCAKLFDIVLCGEDVTLAKPHPEIYLNTLRSLGADASRSIVIEDSISGILAAKAAGISVIAKTGTHTSDELMRINADSIINDLRELLP